MTELVFEEESCNESGELQVQRVTIDDVNCYKNIKRLATKCLFLKDA